MLATTGHRSLPPAAYSIAISIGAPFALMALEGTNVVYDARFAPAVAGDPGSAVFIDAVTAGSIDWIGGPRFEAGTAYAVAARLIEGERGRRVMPYRLVGPRFGVVQLRVRDSGLRARAFASPAPLELSAASFEAARAYARVMHEPPDSAAQVRRAKAYVASPAADGIISLQVPPDDDLIPSSLARVVSSIFRDFSFGTTRDQATQLTRLSLRGLRQQLATVADALDFPWDGWRAVTRRYRLRMAILFLSHPDLPIRDVAKAVGYSSTVALTTAFRAEGLPAPGAIRDAILAYPNTPAPAPAAPTTA